jgi:hypothetical protein
LLQDGFASQLAETSSRRTLKIVAAGLAAVVAVGGAYGFLRWREIREARQGLQIMRELTPDQLIERCGTPEADETTYVHVLIQSGVQKLPTGRVLTYRRDGLSTRLSFVPGADHQWHLQFFDSPVLGVKADAENAYMAVAQLPCMKRADRFLVQKLSKSD